MTVFICFVTYAKHTMVKETSADVKRVVMAICVYSDVSKKGSQSAAAKVTIEIEILLIL